MSHYWAVDEDGYDIVVRVPDTNAAMLVDELNECIRKARGLAQALRGLLGSGQ